MKGGHFLSIDPVVAGRVEMRGQESARIAREPISIYDNNVKGDIKNQEGTGVKSGYSWLPGLRDYTAFQNAPPSAAAKIAPQVPNRSELFTRSVANEYSSIEQKKSGARHMILVFVFIILYLIVLVGLPVAMIIVGGAKLRNCPLSSAIPRFLVAFGSAILTFNCHGVAVRYYEKSLKSGRNEEFKAKIYHRAISFALILSILIIFVYGSVLIYSHLTNVNHDEPSSGRYCDKLVYDFALIVISTIYAACALICFMFCVGSCVAGLMSAHQNSSSTSSCVVYQEEEDKCAASSSSY